MAILKLYDTNLTFRGSKHLYQCNFKITMILREYGEVVSSPTARVFAAGVAPGEMAMSEDYTCVISRGPNPRTRHIFDDCIVESCGDVLVDNGPGTPAPPAGGAMHAAGNLQGMPMIPSSIA
ncbi:hypothetical protein TRIUR3_26044 [Triticum urartu]|uniref:Uncharacterized protein n=1 Tax=Triticum urartu TaxID=4572 RepID=M7ZRG5_TRIUA|nr:hypothetical protein TRIUR3_26044 [Triticum urartu]